MLMVAALTSNLLTAIPPTLAQGASDGGAGGLSTGRHGGRRGDGRRQRAAASAMAAQDAPQLRPDPAQRLDPGAILCETEAGLLEHQAAILARLDGRNAGGSVGCRLVATMTAVTVVARHGPASTEVRLPGSPQQVGWTDAAVHDGLSTAR